VDAFDDVRLGETEEVVRAAQLLRVRREACSAECRVIETMALDHRPHRAVDDQDPLPERFPEVALGECLAIADG